MRRPRPCLGCRQLTRNASRCDRCQAERQQQIDQVRGTAHQRGYDAEWQRIAAAAVAQHRAQYGDWCPGWGVPDHQASDLTGDHLTPKHRGGTNDRSNVGVLCRACNARKRDH